MELMHIYEIHIGEHKMEVVAIIMQLAAYYYSMEFANESGIPYLLLFCDRALLLLRFTPSMHFTKIESI